MRFVTTAIAGLIAVLLLVSCSTPDSGGFWAQRVDTRSWYQVDAQLLGETALAQVYVEKTYAAAVGAAGAQSIAEEFSNNVYPAVRDGFGDPSDVDSDGKIAILILDIKDSYTPGGSYVAGYFDANNEFDTQYSNRREMLYMDCSPGIPGSDTFNLTMAHELQHLINFNQNVFAPGAGGDQDAWINEGLSNAAEYVYQGHVTQKIADYNTDSNGFIAQGVSFQTWFGLYENYVAGYLFFQWLRVHANDDIGIYKRIINDTDTDYKAVLDQLQADSDWNPVGLTSQDRWKEVVRSWYVANLFVNGPTPFNYGSPTVDAELAILAPKRLTGASNEAFPLYPGEGVYVELTGPEAMSAGTVVDYAWLDEPTTQVVTAPGVNGNTLLAYNHDSYAGGVPLYENTDLLPAMAPASPPSVARSAAAARGPRPVDVVFGPDGIRKPFNLK